jgi:hypothetical protein
MDERRFDTWTKLFHTAVSRRTTAKGLASLALAGILVSSDSQVIAAPRGCLSEVQCKGTCCPIGANCVKGKNAKCVCPPGRDPIPSYPDSPHQICCPPEFTQPAACNAPGGSDRLLSDVCCPTGTTDCWCVNDAVGTTTCTCCDCSVGGTCACTHDAFGNAQCDCPGCTCTAGAFVR